MKNISERAGHYRAFILGIIAAVTIMGVVMYMASKMIAWGGAYGTIPPALALTPRAYIPLVMRGHAQPAPMPTTIPTPIPAKKSLNTCCGGDLPAMFAELGADWYYGWNTACGQIGNVPQYPMVRDLSQLAILQANPTMLDSCDRPVLGFNEPENQDCSAGSCMTLAELVAAWHELEALLPNHQLVSPAFLMSWSQQAYDLIDFIDAYEVAYQAKPRFDMVAVHEYGSESLGTWSQAFNITRDEYLATKAALSERGYNVPIYITEMGWWANDPTSMLSRMSAEYYLNAWIQFCDSDSLCEYLNWFGLEQGPYWFVSPLYFEHDLTLAGQAWRDWN